MLTFASLINSKDGNQMKLRIKEILKERGLSLKDLAETMGISNVTLSVSINGNPTLKTLSNIAEALNVHITDLFEKDPISGIIVINEVTHRIETFDQLVRLCDDLKPQSNA